MIDTDTVNRLAGEHLYGAVHAFRRQDYIRADRRLDRALTACEALLLPTQFDNRHFKTTFFDVLRLEVKHQW